MPAFRFCSFSPTTSLCFEIILAHTCVRQFFQESGIPHLYIPRVLNQIHTVANCYAVNTTFPKCLHYIPHNTLYEMHWESKLLRRLLHDRESHADKRTK